MGASAKRRGGDAQAASGPSALERSEGGRPGVHAPAGGTTAQTQLGRLPKRTCRGRVGPRQRSCWRDHELVPGDEAHGGLARIESWCAARSGLRGRRTRLARDHPQELRALRTQGLRRRAQAPDAGDQEGLATGRGQKLASPETEKTADANTRECLPVRRRTYRRWSHAEDLRGLDRVQKWLGRGVVHRSRGRNEL